MYRNMGPTVFFLCVRACMSCITVKVYIIYTYVLHIPIYIYPHVSPPLYRRYSFSYTYIFIYTNYTILYIHVYMYKNLRIDTYIYV